MPAVQKDLAIEQGATFEFSFTWLRGADAESATPVNLTGFSGRMQIRKSQKAPVLASVTTDADDGIEITDPSGGEVSVKISAEKTDLLTAKAALYDLEMVSPDGDVYRVLQGSVTVSPNITQDDDDPSVG